MTVSPSVGSGGGSGGSWIAEVARVARDIALYCLTLKAAAVVRVVSDGSSVGAARGMAAVGGVVAT